MYCGSEYRHFTPLATYARNFACECVGRVDQILFCDSLEMKGANCNILKTLDFALKKAKQSFIFIKRDSFIAFLKSLNLESQGTSIGKNALLIHSVSAQGEQSAIWLIDLQESCKRCEELEHLQKRIKQKNALESPLYLYPLGIDAQSAQTLLMQIAEDFCVRLEIAYAESHLEILSAINGDLEGFLNAINEMFNHKIFGTFNLAESIILLLRDKHLKITCAESCTGGLLAYYLTKESGASAVFDGSVISYANAIKEAWLEVKEENLTQFGAVSEAVVSEMLDGALRLSGADFALATSGIAGPTGGSIHKPVGTVYIGVKSTNGAQRIERFSFSGDRNFIQEQATLTAYLLFLRFFLETY